MTDRTEILVNWHNTRTRIESLNKINIHFTFFGVCVGFGREQNPNF